jgi:hypothetical protein
VGVRGFGEAMLPGCNTADPALHKTIVHFIQLEAAQPRLLMLDSY